MNKVILMGRLTRDPEVRYTQTNNTMVVSFSLAVIYRNISLEFIIFLFLITSLTDTFAYITGRLIGRHKLIEVISPNKTWEGFIGGSIISTFICTNYYITLINPNVSISIHR